MGKNSGGEQAQTTTQEPWSGVQPYMRDIYSKGAAYLDSPMGQPYPYAQTAGISPEMETALQMQTQRAIGGSPLVGQAQQQMGNIMGGKFLGANPYLDPTFERMAGKVGEQYQDIIAPSIASQMGLAGRTGSGAHQQALERSQGRLGETLSGLATDVYGGDYGRERENMMRAMSMAPGMAQQDYGDISKLMGVGGAREAYKGQEIQDAMGMYGAQQNLPMEKLQQFSGLLGGGQGFGTQTQTQPQYSNSLTGMMGGAATGAGLASALGATNPWVLGGSALAGGIGGLF
jgi:hypothetical protein